MEVTQPALPGLTRRRRPAAAAVQPAAELPVARVVVDLPQPHLDREFDYLVPEAMSATARPGVRVRVRFAGRDVDGWVVARVGSSDHDGTLAPLRRVVSGEVVLTDEVLALCRAVADRWAGTLPDVLRLAVPPRHARVEQEDWAGAPVGDAGAPVVGVPDEAAPGDTRGDRSPSTPRTSAWAPLAGGAALLRRLAAGEGPRAVWQALPDGAAGGAAWAVQIAEAALATRAGRRGTLVVVPTERDVETVLGALATAGVPRWSPGAVGGAVRLVADDGPAVRYRSFLAAARGVADVVVGTRAAAFAPVARLGLAVCWDDSDPLHAEPRAPYPHAREVLALRAVAAGAGLLVGGYVRSVAGERWVAEGWARPVVAERATVRGAAPRVVHLDRVELAREGAAAAARLPSAAWRTIQQGLTRGPVLVQVPRAGYLPGVACARCRTTARCRVCAGPLRLGAAGATPSCAWCGALAGGWRCAECGHDALRATAVGAERTADELGRAFPGVTVRRSTGATGVLDRVVGRPSLVVATQGAEPAVPGGYAAAVLLDGAVTAGRPGLGAEESALRHWTAAAALVRPAGEGGVVLLVGEVPGPLAGALVRWDPAGFAQRLLTERAALGLPPAAYLVSVEGERQAVQGLVTSLTVPVAVRGPLPVGDAPTDVLDPEQHRTVRALLQAPRADAGALVADLAGVLASRSAHRLTPVRVRVEPEDVALT